jgi:peptidoglycan/LPS O-acetylase OafA/YrhL
MRLLLLLLLLTITSQVLGQGMRPATQPDSAVAVQAMAPNVDTVAAIHRLFAAKRKRTLHFAIGTVGVAGIGVVLIGTASSGWDGLGQAVLGATLVALVALPAVVAEAVTAADYNKKSERRTVEEFHAHKLPRYLKRKLKPKYFQEPQAAGPSRE